MKRLITFMFFLYLSSNLSFGQLLKNPPISVHDFEVALTYPDHLKKILSENGFVSASGVEGKLITEHIKNPLFPELEAIKSCFFWRVDSALQFGPDVIRRVSIYDWKAGHGPQPNVVRTIVIFLNENATDSGEIDLFLKNVMSGYTKQGRGTDDSDYFNYAPWRVFTKNDDHKIEVRTGKTWFEPGWVYSGYNVSFDLLN